MIPFDPADIWSWTDAGGDPPEPPAEGGSYTLRRYYRRFHMVALLLAKGSLTWLSDK